MGTEPQLLTVIEKDDLKKWTPSEWLNWQFEPKKDGARCTIIDGEAKSRTGKPLNNLRAVLQEFGHLAAGCVYDGEIVGKNWADTMHNARAGQGDRAQDALTFHVFDMLTIKEWNEQKCDRDLHDRHHLLTQYLPESEHIKIVKPYSINSYAAFEVFYKQCLAEGCDGVVLKLLHSMYEFKRTKTWLKVKPDHTLDGKVVGIREGKLKYTGVLGALEFEYEGVVTNVSGMTDIQRTMWWEDPTLIVGKTIEVKCRGIHPTGKLIEPRFERIREDK